MYTFSLDEEAAAILKEVPKTKKSKFVSDAVKVKSRTFEAPPVKEAPKIEVPRTFRVKI